MQMDGFVVSRLDRNVPLFVKRESSSWLWECGNRVSDFQGTGEGEKPRAAPSRSGAGLCGVGATRCFGSGHAFGSGLAISSKGTGRPSNRTPNSESRACAASPAPRLPSPDFASVPTAESGFQNAPPHRSRLPTRSPNKTPTSNPSASFGDSSTPTALPPRPASSRYAVSGSVTRLNSSSLIHVLPNPHLLPEASD